MSMLPERDTPHNAVFRRPTVSVIIVTRHRPDMLRRCLEALLAEQPTPDEVIVVDSSDDDQSQAVLDGFPGVQRIRLRGERNNRPRAKNVGIAASSGAIVAFLDDDSIVREGWLRRILEAFGEDATIGGVGGRAINNGKVDWDGAEPIGKVYPDGTMTHVFDGDSGHIIEVDHFRGCNMAFRRDALLEVGGFDASYTGTNLLEESDACLRVKRSGRRLLYTPYAVVDHLTAPRAGAQRFGLAYEFSSQRNTMFFLYRHFGARRTLTTALRALARCMAAPSYTFIRRSIRGAFTLSGLVVGLIAAIGAPPSVPAPLAPDRALPHPDGTSPLVATAARDSTTPPDSLMAARPGRTSTRIRKALRHPHLVIGKARHGLALAKGRVWSVCFVLTGPRRRLGPGTLVRKSIKVIGPGRVVIGESADIHDTPTLAATRPEAAIRIGARAIINGAMIFAQSSIVIGDDAILSDCSIVDNDGHPVEPALRRSPSAPVGTKPVSIGNNVWIGSHASILKGVTIGDNSVIGTGAVVTNDVPTNVVVAGNPARVVKSLDADEVSWGTASSDGTHRNSPDLFSGRNETGTVG